MSSIQVIEFRDGRYRLNIREFENILRSSADNLVAIYSVNGPKRMGKSFILNYKIRYLNNYENNEWISCEIPNTFKSRGGSKRETTGVWMWSQPFVFEKSDGTKISLFLMDTQGCFDSQTSNNDNAIVFALSALLSSVMIFNIRGQLSEDILQFLQQYVGFARLGDSDSKDEPFQKLMFLIRDWQYPNEYPFGYYDDKTSINGKNYKRDHFDITEDIPQDVKSVHESIISNFKHISFYLMPYPGEEVAQSSDNRDQMTPNFRHYLSQFVPMVLKSESIVAKKIGGEYITGAQMIEFANMWGKLFESDGIPQLNSIFITTAEIQNQMALKRSIDCYKAFMGEKVKDWEQIGPLNLEEHNKALFVNSIKLFTSAKCLGGEVFERKYLDLLLDELNEEYLKYQIFILSEVEVKMAEMQKQVEIIKREEERVANVMRMIALEEAKRREEQRLEIEMQRQRRLHWERMEREAKRREDERRENDRKVREMNQRHEKERQRQEAERKREQRRRAQEYRNHQIWLNGLEEKRRVENMRLDQEREWRRQRDDETCILL